MMLRLRLLCMVMTLGCLLWGSLGVSALELEGEEVYCFGTADFSQENITGVCLTDLPAAERGMLYLGNRMLRPGDVLTAEQVNGMTFLPRQGETTQTAAVSYLPIFQDGVGEEAVLTLSIRGREDKAPVAEDSAGETYKNLPLEGSLKVRDPEEQAMTFTVTRQPKRGTVEIRQDGTFTYTPKKNKVGVDSFVYTATDETGHVSREAAVTITILKPSDAAQYTDTLGQSCRFAAEWMKHTGIFVGESVSGNPCFQPQMAVSRGQFVSMLVKSLELSLEDSVPTHYADEIPRWLQPYLAAAVRSGLVSGVQSGDTFRAGDAITGAEAAAMIQNALDLPAGDLEASDAVAVLNRNGFSLDGEADLTRGAAAQALYQASLLREEAPGMRVIRANS